MKQTKLLTKAFMKTVAVATILTIGLTACTSGPTPKQSSTTPTIATSNKINDYYNEKVRESVDLLVESLNVKLDEKEMEGYAENALKQYKEYNPDSLLSDDTVIDKLFSEEDKKARFIEDYKVAKIVETIQRRIVVDEAQLNEMLNLYKDTLDELKITDEEQRRNAVLDVLANQNINQILDAYKVAALNEIIAKDLQAKDKNVSIPEFRTLKDLNLIFLKDESTQSIEPSQEQTAQDGQKDGKQATEAVQNQSSEQTPEKK